MGLREEILQLKHEVGHSLEYLMHGLEDFPLFEKPLLEFSDEHKNKFSQLNDLKNSLANCTACNMHLGRKNLVFSEGNPEAKICFIEGEVYEEENLSGRPFQGAGGELFSKMLAAMKLQREDVYLLSTIKCRGPNARPPTSDEIIACSQFWMKQIQIVQPQLIVCMGDLPAQILLRGEFYVANLRQKKHFYKNIPCYVTYHPRTLIKEPDKKKAAWEDLQIIMKGENLWRTQ